MKTLLEAMHNLKEAASNKILLQAYYRDKDIDPVDITDMHGILYGGFNDEDLFCYETGYSSIKELEKAIKSKKYMIDDFVDSFEEDDELINLDGERRWKWLINYIEDSSVDGDSADSLFLIDSNGYKILYCGSDSPSIEKVSTSKKISLRTTKNSDIIWPYFKIGKYDLFSRFEQDENFEPTIEYFDRMFYDYEYGFEDENYEPLEEMEENLDINVLEMITDKQKEKYFDLLNKAIEQSNEIEAKRKKIEEAKPAVLKEKLDSLGIILDKKQFNLLLDELPDNMEEVSNQVLNYLCSFKDNKKFKEFIKNIFWGHKSECIMTISENLELLNKYKNINLELLEEIISDLTNLKRFNGNKDSIDKERQGIKIILDSNHIDNGKSILLDLISNNNVNLESLKMLCNSKLNPRDLKNIYLGIHSSNKELTTDNLKYILNYSGDLLEYITRGFSSYKLNENQLEDFIKIYRKEKSNPIVQHPNIILYGLSIGLSKEDIENCIKEAEEKVANGNEQYSLYDAIEKLKRKIKKDKKKN